MYRGSKVIENTIDVQFSTGIPVLTVAEPQNVVLHVCRCVSPKNAQFYYFSFFFIPIGLPKK